MQMLVSSVAHWEKANMKLQMALSASIQEHKKETIQRKLLNMNNYGKAIFLIFPTEEFSPLMFAAFPSYGNISIYLYHRNDQNPLLETPLSH